MQNAKLKLKTKVFLLSIITVFGLFGAALVPANTALAQYAVPTCTSATLNGNVITNGAPTTVWFEWGPGSSIIYSTARQTFSSDSNFSQLITGLTEGSQYSFRAQATNQNGNATSQTITFTTNTCQVTPTVSLTANPSTITSGQSSTLSWTSTNATSCSLSQFGNVPTSGSRTVMPSYTTTYNITCTSSTGQQAFDSATVTVTQPQTCNDPSATNYGGALPCRYAPTTCQDPSATNYGGLLPCRYAPTTCQDPSATNYGGLLPCRYAPTTCQDPNATNYGGALPCRYNQIPTVSLTADSSSVPYNGSTNLHWTSTNANTCSGSNGTNGWAGTKSLTGSFFTGNLTNTTTYNITCTSSTGQQAFDSVTVSVGSQPPQTCNDPSATNYGGTLPCRYAPQTCNDPSATNYGGALPCRYAPTTCQDPNATNFGGALPCQYAQRPTVTLTADNQNVQYNGSTNLHWTSTNATSCSGSNGTNGWSGTKSLTGSFFTNNLTNSTTYNITCVNSIGQQAFDSVTVSVANQPPQTCQDSSATNYGGQLPCQYQQRPTVTIYASPTTVNYNGSSTVTWNSNNATSCSGSGGTNGWSGSRSLSGSFFTGSMTNTTTFSINCSNSSGSASDSVTVYVNNQPQTCQDSSATNYGGQAPCTYQTLVCQDPAALNYRVSLPCTYRQVQNPPTVSIFADQTNLPFNGSTTVRWNTTNATSCFASGGSVGWAGVKSIGPGSFFTGSLTATRTYSITCSNSTGSASDAVTVVVRPQVITTTTTVAARPPATSLLLVTSTVDRNQPIVPTLDNTNPCPGDEINYTITYQNVGTGAVTNLTLRVDLPLAVDYVSSNPANPNISGNTLFFTLGSLRAGGQGTVTIRVHVRNNIPAGTNLNFPATLSYVDPAGLPQSVSATVSADVCGVPIVPQANGNLLLGANVFGAGFLPTSIFGWLLLLILILILVLLAKYLFGQPLRRKTITTLHEPLGQKTTTTTIE